LVASLQQQQRGLLRPQLRQQQTSSLLQLRTQPGPEHLMCLQLLCWRTQQQQRSQLLLLQSQTSLCWVQMLRLLSLLLSLQPLLRLA
jgi:hypothetical protein